MKKQLDKKIFGIGITLVGILAIIFAVICWGVYVDFTDGNYMLKETYGGDAYTGIQNAAAQTANNIIYLNTNLGIATRQFCTCMGYLLCIVGALLLIVGVCKTIEAFKKQPADITGAQSSTTNM